MKSRKCLLRLTSSMNLRREELQGRGSRITGALGFLGLGLVVLACSSGPSPQPTTATQPAQPQPEAALVPQVPPGQAAKTLAEIGVAGKDPNELARYIFENHGCKNCHTLDKNGKFGFSERGKQAGKNFEGCISLLTAMNVIAQAKEADRTPEEKLKAAHFQEYGCTECHQITPGKLGLTPLGKRLVTLHMACTDVQKILNP